MGLPVQKDEKKYTYKDYLSWPEGQRWELINGIPYDMTPAPSRRHQEISGALFNKFYSFLEGKPCRVYAAPFDVRLPDRDENDEEIETVVQPDIAIVCDRSKLDDEGCLGAPDLIVEITSPHTAGKDLKIKFNLYEKSGVTEYWIVDPNNQTVVVYKMGQNQEYGRPDVYTFEDSVQVGIFEGLAIDLKMVLVE
jgi:Uma2 family endonuclease